VAGATFRRKLFLRSQIILKFFYQWSRLRFRVYEFLHIYIYIISNTIMYVTESWVLVKIALAAAVDFLPLEGFSCKICVFLFLIFLLLCYVIALWLFASQQNMWKRRENELKKNGCDRVEYFCESLYLFLWNREFWSIFVKR
jgi:hypothetical protein